MNELSAEMLATCLAEIRAGRLTVEECAAFCPAIAEELRSLLEVAMAIPPLPSVAPDPMFRLQGRAALLQAIEVESKTVTSSPLRRLWEVTVGGWGQPTQTSVRRMGMPALIIALVIALTTAAGGGAVFASQDALPGDALYQVKAIVEQVQVSLANGDEAKAQVYLDLAAKRVAEVRKASESGNTDAAKASGEAFVEDVAQADEHLAKAAADGRDVSKLAAQLEENLARHSTVLAAASERAPEQAKQALASAAEAASNGLKVASSNIEGVAAAGRQDDDGSALPTAGISAVGQLTPTATITSTISLTFTETVSDVQKLADDPNVPGQSYNGLLAKLREAQAALDRGQPEVAMNILGAFLNEINAMQNSDHISADNYELLLAKYTALMASLDGMQDAKKNEGHSKSGKGNDETPTATSVATPAAMATPHANPEQRGNGSKNMPPVVSPPRGEPMPKGKK